MSWLLSNPEKPYIDSAKTDVMRTWRKHGFVPPSEVKTSVKETISGIRYVGDIEASENKASEPLKKDDLGPGIPKTSTTAQGG